MINLISEYNYPNNRTTRTSSIVQLSIEKNTVYQSINSILTSDEYHYPNNPDKKITSITDYLITTDTLDIDHLWLGGLRVDSISIEGDDPSPNTLVTGRALQEAISDIQKTIDTINPNGLFNEDSSVITLPITDPAFDHTAWEWSGWEVVRGGTAVFTSGNETVNSLNYIKLRNYPFYKQGKYFISIDVDVLDSGYLAVLDESDRELARAMIPGPCNFIFIPSNNSGATLKFRAVDVLRKEQIVISRINIYYLTTRLERYMEYIIPTIISGGTGFASIDFVNKTIEDLQFKIDERLSKIQNDVNNVIADVGNINKHVNDTVSNPHGITPAMIGASPTTHTHTYSEVGAASATHTHTPLSIGAAEIDHTHSLDSLGAAPRVHTHNPEDIGAATTDHTHPEYATKKEVEDKLAEVIAGTSSDLEGYVKKEDIDTYIYNFLISHKFIGVDDNSETE